ncbi:MAG: hypothetical protein IJU03_06970, partial [Thermoguttaceae bacterium]|nr:hypothetical protein [Thermoguttaceae bacterium]
MARFENNGKLNTTRFGKRLYVVSWALGLCAALTPIALALQAPQDPPAPAPEAPAAPTDEEKNAALEKIGVTSTGQIPTPSDDPAAAAKMVVDLNKALANPDPKEAPKSEAIKIEGYDPQRSYTRLLYPSVATYIGLSDDQNRRISEIITERSQKLAAAPKEEWTAIIQENEKQLQAVLTPEQDERFTRGITQKTIVMRFNKERWSNVLNWFATELGLQLIMSAPPQGTFTYNSKTAYAPKDALDILNADLNFRGYTLFRYNNMLILHDLKTSSIPLQYLPKIEPEDLPNQSRFDYVALTIPLEQRNYNAVLETIRPFRGQYSTVQPLSGNAMMVVDTVNALREIYAAAEGVYNPDPPADRPIQGRGPRPAPETPEWRPYELDSLAYATLQEQIDVFAPGAKALYNPESNIVHYLALPSLHNVIEGLVSRMKEGADPARAAIVKTYSLDRIALATSADQWIIARRLGATAPSAFARFGVGASEEIVSQVVGALEKLVPDAQIEYTEETRTLFVIATAAEHERIAAVLDSIAADSTEKEAPVIKLYAIPKAGPGAISTTIINLLRVVAPMAQPIDSGDGKLLVIGTQAEQDQIAKALEQYKAEVENPDEEFTLKVYVMTTRQVARFTQIYAQIASTPEMRGAVRLPDPIIPTRFAIWGKPAQQAQVAKIVDEIVNAEAYVDSLKPQGLPEPQEPAPAPAEPAPAPAEPAPAPAEPAPAPA